MTDGEWIAACPLNAQLFNLFLPEVGKTGKSEGLIDVARRIVAERDATLKALERARCSLCSEKIGPHGYEDLCGKCVDRGDDMRYYLPPVDPYIILERLDDGWYYECQESFCGAADGGSWLDYNQARRLRQQHRKLHLTGKAIVNRNFITGYEQSIGCICEWAGTECCPVHITTQDVEG